MTGKRRIKVQGIPVVTNNINNPSDGPGSAFRQQDPGATQFFWLDAPGHVKKINNVPVVDLTQVQNMTSLAQKGQQACRVMWHLKIVVSNGNLTSSDFGNGHLSTKF
jgi:hypothetical protein